MTFWIASCCLAFIMCVFLTGILIPQILLVAFRKKLFDEPDERKIHHSTVPRLGGIAFKPVVFLTFSLILGTSLVFGYNDFLNEAGKDVASLAFGFSSIMVLYLVGMADDLIGVRYSAKFVVQILCGVMLAAGGVWVNDLHGIMGIYNIPTWAGYPLTVLIVVFVINAINLIDGIDGLASGLCSVALLFYGISFFILQKYVFAILSFATLGVLVPFFYYNVFGNAKVGKKIFMGDTGSLTIGMMLVFLGLKLALCSAESIFAPNPMVLAFFPLIIPCLDVIRVFIHRLRKKRNPFKPDNSHIHHKLLAVGMSQRAAMGTIVSTSFILTLAGIYLSGCINVNILLFAEVLLWTLMNVWLTSIIKRREAAYVSTSGLHPDR